MHERLAAYYLLFTLHIHKFSMGETSTQELSENPFLPMLAELMLAPPVTLSAPEHAFLVDLFGAHKSLSSQTPTSILAMLIGSAADRSVTPELANQVASAVQAYRAKQESLGVLTSPWRRTGLSRSVFEDHTPPSEVPSREVGDNEIGMVVADEETLLVQPAHLSSGQFEARWIRPVPPRMDIDGGEISWLDVDVLSFEVLWDAGQGAAESPVVALSTLLELATREALLPQQKKELVLLLDTNAALLDQSRLSPDELPDLVENNPAVAFEVLLKLMSSSRIADYLSVLVNMDMTLHSMEVVNRLTTAVDLPTEFIHLYITNCITSCKDVSDKFNQNRLVRLVCVFLQSLIRNKIINVQDLFVEVQAFCIDFIKIREAASLFRMLKALEQDPDAEVDE